MKENSEKENEVKIFKSKLPYFKYNYCLIFKQKRGINLKLCRFYVELFVRKRLSCSNTKNNATIPAAGVLQQKIFWNVTKELFGFLRTFH